VILVRICLNQLLKLTIRFAFGEERCKNEYEISLATRTVGLITEYIQIDMERSDKKDAFIHLFQLAEKELRPIAKRAGQENPDHKDPWYMLFALASATLNGDNCGNGLGAAFMTAKYPHLPLIRFVQ
jgi:hypothetical protein